MVRKHLILTTVVLLLSALLLCACTPKIRLDATTTVTRTGNVTDRAMATPSGSHKIWDESYTYISVKFQDGTSICLWNKLNTKIPEDIGIGDTVEIVYSLEQGTELWILTSIKKV